MPWRRQLAQAFSRLGSEVTIVDQAGRLLSGEDPDAARARCHGSGEHSCGPCRRGRHLRHHRARNLGDRRRDVARWSDVDGRAHGVVAAASACRSPRLRPPMKAEKRVLTRVTFCDPEVAQVELTEAEAAERGGRVAVLPLERVDRAITAGQTAGFIKLIAGPRPVLRSLAGGVLLGATIVASTAVSSDSSTACRPAPHRARRRHASVRYRGRRSARARSLGRGARGHDAPKRYAKRAVAGPPQRGAGGGTPPGGDAGQVERPNQEIRVGTATQREREPAGLVRGDGQVVSCEQTR